ncbi:MAG: sugar phosphate isomerase/epimerase [Kiritimatiellaeota bacterium]|nr:sugar phosphate isomerase/epimerase [Kiritimatiellota bacterium]
MDCALTTRWNAGRHTSGEAMLQEILELGFTRVELGYDLRADLVAGVQRLVRAGVVRVESVHNFCPLPVGASRGSPELFPFTSADPGVRAAAVRHTTTTVRFAASLGARVVVLHAGYVEIAPSTRDLAVLAERGEIGSPAYEKAKLRLQAARDRRAAPHLAWLRQGLEQLLPVLDETGVVLAIEILPWWETVPTEMEMESLMQHFRSPRIRCWYDVGHAWIREHLLQIRGERWLPRLAPYIAGFHLHDVRPPAHDHVMPPRGGAVDFQGLRPFATAAGVLRVLEPSPAEPAEDLRQAQAWLREIWS